MTHCSSSEFAISRDEDGPAFNDAIQLDSAGQLICCIEPLALPRPTADATA
jgi:hypothetical protein